MLFESLLLLITVLFTSVAFLVGCAKKKKKEDMLAAPSVAPLNDPTKSPAKSPSKSQSKENDKPSKENDKEEGEGEKKEGEKKEEEKKEEEKKEEKKEEEKKEDEEGKKSDEKEDGEKKGKKKETLISVTPSELDFKTTITSQKTLKVTNLTDKNIMFKIKASTTNAFLINPVFGKLDGNGSMDVIVTHRPSEKRKDKLVFVSSVLIGKEIEMAKTFKQIKNTGVEVTVQLTSN